MIEFKLQCSDLYEFIKNREAGNMLATVCSQQDAEYTIEQDNPLHFKYVKYSDNEIEHIKMQMEKWQAKCVCTEKWDPTFGHTKGKTTHESYCELRTNMALVQEGDFAGIVDYSKDLGNRYGMSCASIADYKGEPLMFKYWEGYGSSDCDMMYVEQYYLLKK